MFQINPKFKFLTINSKSNLKFIDEGFVLNGEYGNQKISFKNNYFFFLQKTSYGNKFVIIVFLHQTLKRLFKFEKTLFGLYKSLILNYCGLVSNWYFVKFKINGHGYRVQLLSAKSKELFIKDTTKRQTKFLRKQSFFIDLFKNISYIENKLLIIKIGYSHLVYFLLPSIISILRFKKKVIFFGSHYKELFFVFCNFFRNLRLPNIYTGRGIRYKHKRIFLKAGKGKN